MRRAAFYLVLLALYICIIRAPSFAQESYVGDHVCKDCHQDIYKSYIKSGHPHKIQAIDNKPPSFPQNTSPGVLLPPEDKAWSDISYVIGGFYWKARFMDKEGYILTGSKSRQYNLANNKLEITAHWTGYDASKGEKKPYTCGSCHTTGWEETGESGPHQNNLPGIYGTWAQDGVTCEACHGAGSNHTKKPSQFKLSTEESCNNCHIRGDVSLIDAKDELIRHHEQYEDLLASPHKNIGCTSCHNPHESTVYPPAPKMSNPTLCLQCHPAKRVKLTPKEQHSDCISCHMPFIGKSAVFKNIETADGSLPIGDIRTHIFRINTDSQWQMFTDDKKYVRLDDQGKAFISIDRSCLSCHTEKTREWAAKASKAIH